MNCKCGKIMNSKSDRLQRGWKRLEEDVVCPDCWASGFVLRSITFPIVGPLDSSDWPALRDALAKAWGDSTRLANWLMTEQSKSDRVRLPTDEKLWKAPNPYQYPHARNVCPTMASQSVVALCNQVQRKYNAMRIEVVWRGSASLPSFRYPVPYPLPAQSWSARWLSETEKVPVISVPISGTRFDLRLRGSAEFSRQLKAFDALTTGKAVKCEMAIYRKSVSESRHRNGDGPHSCVMVKLVMWLPAETKKSGDKVLVLRRPADSFWRAEIPNRDPWLLHCDHLKSWIIGHEKRLQRFGDDTKFEKRWPATIRENMNTRREEVVRRQHNRLDSFSHNATKMLAAFASRQGVAKVVYENIDGGYLPSFPWFKLCELLKYKLCERGIALEIIEGARE